MSATAGWHDVAGITWFPEYVERVLGLMQELTPEELGTAMVVRALVVSTRNQLRDDDRFVAGHLRSDLRVWRRCKRRLVEVGELSVDGAFLRCRGGAEMVDGILARLEQKAQAGRSSGHARRSKSGTSASHNKGLARTDVPSGDPTLPRTTNTYSLSPSERETVREISAESYPQRAGIALSDHPPARAFLDRIGKERGALLRLARYEEGPPPRLSFMEQETAGRIESQFGIDLRNELGQDLVIEAVP